MKPFMEDNPLVDDISTDEAADDSTIHSNLEDEERLGKIGTAENTVVWKLKAVVVFVVLSATIATALAVYLYTSRSEETQFEEQFEEYHDKVIGSLIVTLFQSFGALDAFATDIVAHTKSTNQTWPFVTIPFFGNRAAKILSLSDPVFVSLLPLVTNETRLEWEAFSQLHGREWVDEHLQLQKNDIHFTWPIIEDYNTNDILHNDNGNIPLNTSQEIFFPKWLTYPTVPRYPPYNWDYFSVAKEQLSDMLAYKSAILSKPYFLPGAENPDDIAQNVLWANSIVNDVPADDDTTTSEPLIGIQFPIFDSLSNIKVDPDTAAVVGSLTSTIYFRDIIANILPPGSNGIVLVVDNACAPTFSYLVTDTAKYLGQGDRHNKRFDEMGISSTSTDVGIYAPVNTGPIIYLEACPFAFHVYPSEALENEYVTKMPMALTIGAVGIFAICAIIFFIYDRSVERRQKVVLTNATKSNAVVASLFPAEVRDRLYDDKDPETTHGNANAHAHVALNANNNKKNSIFGKSSDGNNKYVTSTESTTQSNEFEGNPIAQMYADTTVMFADISGFTAWSSVREPYQVFRLLETLYSAFDRIAREYKVFKVETIGDSYVAVCGLPKPRKNHAVIMSRFASACREKSALLFRELDSTLGPGTADLSIRFGLHSGPTTAGILRGDKSRFQLFGDTVNTAARMESTGQRGRIQISQKTADLLCMVGKTTWIKKRDTMVEAKGKGFLQTYWVDPTSTNTAVTSSTDSPKGESSPIVSKRSSEEVVLDEQSLRMVDWYVENLAELLQQVTPSTSPSLSSSSPSPSTVSTSTSFSASSSEGSENSRRLSLEQKHPRDQVTDSVVIQTQATRREKKREHKDMATLPSPLSDNVMKQLHSYVSTIALMYNDNPFHNFHHATHVGMSARRYMRHINTRANNSNNANKRSSSSDSNNGNSTSVLSLALTDNPLVQFAALFSTLIHDVDHAGCTNATLIAEQSQIATLYNGKSVAEQNSIDVAWDLLTSGSSGNDGEYKDLCDRIYNMDGFRQLVVNLVMATDIFDPELKAWRQSRQHGNNGNNDKDGAISKSKSSTSTSTLVMEQLLQVADVSHTMQHWSIFLKWNKCLFNETMKVYDLGRGVATSDTDQTSPTDSPKKDPSLTWYDGEIGFFDKYIIPMAENLCEQGMIGLDSVEFAKSNRYEWERKGKGLVQSWVAARNK